MYVSSGDRADVDRAEDLTAAEDLVAADSACGGPAV
jgi:hypothetical protein